jgi:hypothetical protein
LLLLLVRYVFSGSVLFVLCYYLLPTQLLYLFIHIRIEFLFGVFSFSHFLRVLQLKFFLFACCWHHSCTVVLVYLHSRQVFRRVQLAPFLRVLKLFFFLFACC